MHVQSDLSGQLDSKSDYTGTTADTSLGLLSEPRFAEKNCYSLKMNLIFLNSQKTSIGKSDA